MPCSYGTSCAQAPSVPCYLSPFKRARITPYHVAIQTFTKRAYLSHPAKLMWRRGRVTVIDRSLLDKTSRPEEPSMEKTLCNVSSTAIMRANIDDPNHSIQSLNLLAGRNQRDTMRLLAHMSSHAVLSTKCTYRTQRNILAREGLGSHEIKCLVGLNRAWSDEPLESSRRDETYVPIGSAVARTLAG